MTIASKVAAMAFRLGARGGGATAAVASGAATAEASGSSSVAAPGRKKKKFWPGAARAARAAQEKRRPLETSQQGALEGAPFGNWNRRGPIRTTARNLGRVIYLVNIPLRMQLPPRPNDLRELVFRTHPRAGKLEIRRVLQLVYGLDVEKVHTLNMESKKKFNPRKRFYYRTASYKKCYVYLRRPITLSKDLFPLNLFYGDPQPAQIEDSSKPAAKDEKSDTTATT